MHIPDDIYRVVTQSMPIPCVDLIVMNRAGMVLLVKRTNHPARGQWWFPGGRVHFLETRHDAALRKLCEECNLTAAVVTELGTHDVLLEGTGTELPSHGITTLFLARIDDATNLKLDEQSRGAEWRTPQDWMAHALHPFVSSSLRQVFE